MTVYQYVKIRLKQEKLRSISELKFHPTRKWRFDFCFPSIMVALEVEGGMFVKSRHRTGIGYINDCEKYNNAVMLGWKVLRVATTSQAAEAIDFIKKKLEELK